MNQNVRAQNDFPPNPLDKPGYVLEFSDEFDVPEIDTNKWIACYLPQWSSCQQSAARYTFAGSNLILQITAEQQAWCPEFDGEVRASALQTGVFSGEIGSKIGQSRFSEQLVVREAQANARKYTPQFGYFETRVRGNAASGTHVSLWMIGYEDIPERSAEICLFELLGNRTSPAASTVRYGVHPWNDPAAREEFFAETFPFDSTQFHIYAVEWTPTHIDFLIDNTKIRTIHQSLQYPMQLMLGIFELPFEGGWNGPYDPAAPYPKTFTVDYVRGYQPMKGYHG
ncbi:MAG: family 16 glycosylhydrolase [Chloroflexi bacterium]|nr:family 16 glycosylhydrolase [Chloroflexota bacterium]